MEKNLIIFIKNPELGKAKTRIAKTMGDEKALAIYKELLKHTLDTTCKVDCNRHLFYSQYINTEDQWSENDFIKQLQIEGGLGDKMKEAFQTVLKAPSRCLIIGSDCGDISKDILTQAFDALQDHDVVLGPTFDGGYYLLGMSKPGLDLFDGVAWSTESVYDQTLQLINKAKASYYELPRLHDIDYEEDYLRWKSSL